MGSTWASSPSNLRIRVDFWVIFSIILAIFEGNLHKISILNWIFGNICLFSSTIGIVQIPYSIQKQILDTNCYQNCQQFKLSAKIVEKSTVFELKFSTKLVLELKNDIFCQIIRLKHSWATSIWHSNQMCCFKLIKTFKNTNMSNFKQNIVYFCLLLAKFRYFPHALGL